MNSPSEWDEAIGPDHANSEPSTHMALLGVVRDVRLESAKRPKADIAIYKGLGDATKERWNAPGFRERRRREPRADRCHIERDGRLFISQQLARLTLHRIRTASARRREKRTGRRLRDLDRPVRQVISAASFQQVRALTHTGKPQATELSHDQKTAVST